jgi:hypothetical protein
MPHLIITYGPAGSGKGHLYPKYTQLLSKCYSSMDPITQDNTFVAEIDQYVESDPDYKDAVFRIICDFFENCQAQLETPESLGTYIKKVLSDFERMDECSATALSADLTRAYRYTRSKYDAKLNADIAQAVKENRNIIFETTGQNSDPLNWLWYCGSGNDNWSGPFCAAPKYVKTVIYPYVDPDRILQQAQERFARRVVGWYMCLKSCRKRLGTGKFTEFSTCLVGATNAPVPRLPNLNELRTLIPVAQRNVIPYIDNEQIENIIIYNNLEGVHDPMVFNIKGPIGYCTSLAEESRKRRFLLENGNGLAPELRSRLMQGLRGMADNSDPI